VSMLKDIEARLKAYEDRREEFEYYSYEQLAIKRRSSNLTDSSKNSRRSKVCLLRKWLD
jgi:hypothetical protein